MGLKSQYRISFSTLELTNVSEQNQKAAKSLSIPRGNIEYARCPMDFLIDPNKSAQEETPFLNQGREMLAIKQRKSRRNDAKTEEVIVPRLSITLKLM